MKLAMLHRLELGLRLPPVGLACAMALQGGCESSPRVGTMPDRSPTVVDVASSTSGPADQASPPPLGPGGTASATGAAGHGRRWVGSWRSASCGERRYERWLDLTADGHFRANDRISPCPPHARCVWSGIVQRKGRYDVSADDRQLALQPDSTAEGSRALSLPARLEWDERAAAPMEGSGADGCRYERR